MQAKILENGDLKITVMSVEQVSLRSLKQSDPDYFDSDDMMRDIFSEFMTNSGYTWIPPEYTNSLTDAPIIGIYGSEEFPLVGGENDLCEMVNVIGAWPNAQGEMASWYTKPEQFWGYMDYAIHSPQDDLQHQGYCIFGCPK